MGEHFIAGSKLVWLLITVNMDEETETRDDPLARASMILCGLCRVGMSHFLSQRWLTNDERVEISQGRRRKDIWGLHWFCLQPAHMKGVPVAVLLGFLQRQHGCSSQLSRPPA